MPQALQLFGYVHAMADSFLGWHEKISGPSGLLSMLRSDWLRLLGYML